MELLIKYKKIFIIVMAVLCIVTIVGTLNPSGFKTALRNAAGFVINPVNYAFSSMGYWIGDRIDFFFEMNYLHDKVRELEDLNSKLMIENTRLAEAKKENEKLSELLQIMAEYTDYDMVGAKIISKTPTDLYDSYTINKGTKDGLKNNMAVLATGGLMGIIIECNYSYSTVISIIDGRASITAKCARTGVVGYVKGNYELKKQGLCSMELIDINAPIQPSDVIVTSSISTNYPPGIIIGLVSEVIPDTNGLTKHAIIEPTVSFNRLETLLIITEEINMEGN